ncbi:16196_t:CDS:2 [Gigaspora margarita]|uniref:16196_t:CDS:1 n=1 Tax=Gigaspora margarita TaxID=4874 RepID=A0ABM8W2K0_GIGMA|nr:16196_t:CDS:2 [Gigaspora margarita]
MGSYVITEIILSDFIIYQQLKQLAFDGQYLVQSVYEKVSLELKDEILKENTSEGGK